MLVACYVVLAPDAIRGIYDTWAACEAAVRGVPGAVYRKTLDRRLAGQLLRGEGRKLPPGRYAFIDGNHLGGIGIVVVRRDGNGSTALNEIATSVAEQFADYAEHLDRLRNPLAELAAAHVVLRNTGDRVLTIVHDYQGVGAWIEGRWKAHDPVIARFVSSCQELIRERGLTVRFEWMNGHQSAAGGDEYALYNGRADELAATAVA
jgi:hypothetical protein